MDKNTTTASVLELQHTTIDGNHLGSLNVDGTLKATVGTDNVIENFDAGKLTSDGTLLATGNGTRLTLLNDTLQDYVGSTGGSIQVDKNTTTASVLELQHSIIDGNSIATASFTVDGKLLADGGTASTIENFNGVGATFQSDGTIHVAANTTVLTLLNDNLNDYVTAGGTIQVDGKTGTGTASAPELEFNNTTIDGSSLASSSFTIDGKLLVDGTTTSTIKNFNNAAGTFQNDGTIQVSGTGSTLTLSNDVLADYIGSTGGTLQVDANAELDLTNTTTIDGNSLGTFTNAGTLLSLAGLNTITRFGNGEFTNAATGSIEVTSGTGGGSSPTAPDGDDDTNVNTLVLDQDYLSNAGLVQVDATAELELTGGTTIDGGTLAILAGGELESVSGNNTIKNLTSFSNTGSIEVLAGTRAIGTAGTLTNNGTLVATGGGTLEIDSDLYNVGLLEATANSTIDFKGSAITWIGTATPNPGHNGILITGSGSTLLVDSTSGKLTLKSSAPATGNGVVSLVGGTIKSTSAKTLDNLDNAISGYGTIGNVVGGVGDGYLTLINETAGIINASVSGQALVIATGNIIANAGLLEASGGGVLDVKDSQISNVFGGSHGSITVDGTSTFKVDNADLQLTGQGSMTLTSGSKVIGNGSTATLLENFDNTITGAGTIGSGAAGMLSLKNDLGGTINANVNDPTKMLTLHTGATVINLGLLEATSGGTLDVQDAEINNSGTAASNTGIAINAATLLVDVGSLTLDGGGDVALTGGTITGAAMAPNPLNELINQDNIFGTGTISNLDLDNSGTINANDTSGGTLRLATGMQIDNLAGGTLEATGGGKLEIDDNLSNSGLLKADTLGGTAAPAIDFRGSSISWDGSAPPAPGTNGVQLTGNTNTGAFLVVDPSSGGKLTLTGTAAQSGVVSLAGGTIKAPNLVHGTMTPFTGTYMLENVNNTIEGNGSIARNLSGSGKLILQNDAAGTINATGVLTLNTGNSITNSGLLEATAGGTLDVRDTSINNQGSGLQGLGISLASGTLLEVDIAPGTGGTLTLTGGGTVVIAGGTIKGNDHDSEKLNNSNNFISGSGTIGGTNFSLINDGTIQALGGTLEIKPNITRSSPTVLSGNLQIGDGATLKLDGSTPETINFLMDTNSNQGTLYLNDTTGGTGASNTVNTTTLTPSTSGTFEITGPGDVTATSGSGIRFVTTTTGTANITIDGSGNVSGGSGFVGVTAQLNNALDSGSITIHQFGNVSGGQEGIVAITQGNGNVSVTTVDNVTVTTNNSSTANKDFSAIFAAASGTGSLLVATASGHTIDSTNGGAANGGAGIQALNEDSNATDNAGGITVNAYGTIDSGSVDNANGTEPAGIIAGYTSAASGSVEVDNYATINAAAGPGILAFMGTGAGDVTVNLGPGVQITAQNSASPTSTTNTNSAPFGIQAGTSGTGNVYVDMSSSANDMIRSGSAGIAAFNDFDPTSSTTNSSNPGTIQVVAYGTIDSGTILTNSSTRPAGIIATYQGGTGSSANQPNQYLYGSISITSYATITAQAGDGIRAVNYGVGDIVITDEASTTITAQGSQGVQGQYGIDASSSESGNITVTTSSFDQISSGGSGIRAVNVATSTLATTSAASTIQVTANGAISSEGTADTTNTTVSPAGILAGFFGAGPTSPTIASTTPLQANSNVLSATSSLTITPTSPPAPATASRRSTTAKAVSPSTTTRARPSADPSASMR